MDRDTHIDNLIAKFEDGTISEEEYQALIGWYNSFDDSKATLTSEEANALAFMKMRIRRRLLDSIHQGSGTRSTFAKIKKWVPYAAAGVLVLGAVSIWLLQDNILGFTDSQISQSTPIHDIPPGTNRATLTLSSGKMIDLKEEEDGIIIEDKLSYADGSSVFGPEVGIPENQYYVLSTPRGGTYKVSLPDGTMVWLNAASSLKYPSRFSENERVVEISGEAYFSVARDKRKPFKVVNSKQTVSVLGTDFNISAYEDDEGIETTLVNGSIIIEANATNPQSTVLRQGQQGSLINGAISVREVNTEPYAAWKDGLFYFENTPFDVMMRQIARWYNVDVLYKKGIPKESFSGKLRRSSTLVGFLEMLRTSDIKVELGADTIFVN